MTPHKMLTMYVHILYSYIDAIPPCMDAKVSTAMHVYLVKYFIQSSHLTKCFSCVYNTVYINKDGINFIHTIMLTSIYWIGKDEEV